MARWPCCFPFALYLAPSTKTTSHKNSGWELIPAPLGSLSFLNSEQFWNLQMLGNFPRNFGIDKHWCLPVNRAPFQCIGVETIAWGQWMTPPPQILGILIEEGTVVISSSAHSEVTLRRGGVQLRVRWHGHSCIGFRTTPEVTSYPVFQPTCLFEFLVLVGLWWCYMGNMCLENELFFLSIWLKCESALEQTQNATI